MAERDWTEEPRMIKRVAIYTPAWIITGNLRLAAPVRLSDLMNNWDEAFFPVDAPRIVNLRNGQSETPTGVDQLLAFSDEILILHEISLKTGQQASRAPEMQVEKRPTMIQAYLRPFRVEGMWHLAMQSDMAACLNWSAGTFLPVTDASISCPVGGRIETIRVPFALLRRTRLVVGKVMSEQS